MLLTLGIALLVLWLVVVLAFKLTVAFVHLLLFLAVVAVIVHFVRRRAPRP